MILVSNMASFGGGESILLDIAREAARTEKVVVVIPGEGEFKRRICQLNNISVVVIRFSVPSLRCRNILSVFAWLSMAKLFLFLSRNKNENIVFNSAEFILPCVAFFATCERFAFIAHGWWEGTGGYNGILARLIRGQIVAVSEIVKYASVFPKDKVHVIKFGVDLTRFNVGRRSLKKRPNANLCVGVLGRISPEKNQIVFLKAFKRLQEKGLGVSALIAGEIADQNYAEYLSSYLKDNGVEGVTFLPKAVDPLEFYNEVDIVVVPSWYESLGIVSQEAMALGIPVVSTNVGAPSELIDSHVTGLLFKTGDSDDLSEKLLELITNDDLRKQISTNAASYALEHLSARQTSRQFISILGKEKI